MYEIWLAMNIVWEIALGIWPVLLLALVAWIVVMVLAARRHRPQWRANAPIALLAGLGVMIIGVLGIPSLTHSSLAEMGYWVDWANLLAIATGFGAVAVAFAWPLLTLTRSSPPAPDDAKAQALPVHPGADITVKPG